jgi:hypothetical protein
VKVRSSWDAKSLWPLTASSAGRHDNLTYREAIDSTRPELMAQALAQSHGNRAATANLRLHEKYFLRMIKRLESVGVSNADG